MQDIEKTRQGMEESAAYPTQVIEPAIKKRMLEYETELVNAMTGL